MDEKGLSSFYFVLLLRQRWNYLFAPSSKSQKVEFEKVEFMRSGFSAFLRYCGLLYSPNSFTLR